MEEASQDHLGLIILFYSLLLQPLAIKGEIHDIDMEKLLAYIFFDKLQINPADHPIFFIEPMNTSESSMALSDLNDSRLKFAESSHDNS